MYVADPGYKPELSRADALTSGLVAHGIAGEFGVKVGIPAKSGVGGGIACSVKGRMGIGVYGPALDSKGYSVGAWLR